MGNENELNIGLQNVGRASGGTDPVRTDRRDGTDNGGGAVRGLTNGTIGFRLMRLMIMERLHSRKPDESGQRNEGCKSCELFHTFSISSKSNVSSQS